MWEYNHNYSDELYHWGIKGMRWGVRRFQKKDGSLTPAGRKRYITVAEGKLRAEAAATKARRTAYKQMNESPRKHTKFQYDAASNLAAEKARRESIAKDKATNKQLRSEKYQKVVDKFTNSKLGSKYKLNKDPNKELKEVEGDPSADSKAREAKIKKAKAAAKKGAVKATEITARIGTAYLTDQIFFGGAGTKLAKNTIKYTGRAAVTAYMKARGATDIRWYD